MDLSTIAEEDLEDLSRFFIGNCLHRGTKLLPSFDRLAY